VGLPLLDTPGTSSPVGLLVLDTLGVSGTRRPSGARCHPTAGVRQAGERFAAAVLGPGGAFGGRP
jgi:hypothetical protein